jgi:hypothetical protein
MKHLSTALLGCVLLLIPLAVWTEHESPKVWQNRLVWPEFSLEPNRHTPRHTDGTFLPPVITANRTLAENDSPVLLTGTTRIPTGVTLTIAAGTTVYAHEFATLVVDGTIVLEGSTAHPVVLTTNELHPENQVWGGITVTKTGRARIAHAVIRAATPAITCQPGARATLASFDIETQTLGMFTASRFCSLADSTIRSTRDGIVAVGVEPPITNTAFFVARHDIKRITTY